MDYENTMTIGGSPYDGEEAIEFDPTPESLASNLKLTFDEVRKPAGTITRKWAEFDGEDWHPIYMSWDYYRRDDEIFCSSLTIRIDGHDMPGKFRLELADELIEQVFIRFEKK